jgi:hypothetical protein
MHRMDEGPDVFDATTLARRIAQALESRRHEYAIGGAVALGYWSEPRGTLDVDCTLFLAPDKPSECIWLLQEIGCTVSATHALQSLQEHGFCRVDYGALHLDVFLPILPFYELARQRRRRVLLGDQEIMIWDAETLAVFKMMFFRRKDVADVEQMLRIQGAAFDRDWVRQQLSDLYGSRDPRLAQWDELVRELSQ